MKRNGIDLTKADTYDLGADHPSCPKDEIDANPNINEEDQNP